MAKLGAEQDRSRRMKPHQYLRIALAGAVVLAVVIIALLDIPGSTVSLVILAVVATVGLIYLVLRLTNVLEKPRPPAQGRFENGRFIDETPDIPNSAGSPGGAAFLVEAILDLVDLFNGRGRRKDRR